MGEAMIFLCDTSDEAVGQCDSEDIRKLEALGPPDGAEAASILSPDSDSHSSFSTSFNVPQSSLPLINEEEALEPPPPEEKNSDELQNNDDVKKHEDDTTAEPVNETKEGKTEEIA